jgi:hypothetical protein
MDEAGRRQLVTAVRDLCLQELLEAYEQAGISGLCAEGRWEVAVGRLRTLTGDELAARLGPPAHGEGKQSP